MKKRTRDFLLIFSVIIGILTILVLLSHTFLFWRQTNIQNRLTTLEETSLIPNDAKLEIAIHHYSQMMMGDLYFSRCDICSSKNYSCLNLYIQNKGRLDTGKVQFFLISNHLEFEKDSETTIHTYVIDNIASGETHSECINFKATEDLCALNNLEEVWVSIQYLCAFCENHSEVKFFTFKLN